MKALYLIIPFAPLLGQLLDYHRREAKPEWWAFFDRCKKSLDELMDVDVTSVTFKGDEAEAMVAFRLDRSAGGTSRITLGPRT